MAKPPGSLSSEMVAVVSSLVAVKPALPSCAESAIVKQPACAAASSSSGLVPTPFSNRVAKEYCVCLSTPLSVEMVPLPSFKPPCHTADALRCITSLLLQFSQYSSQENSIPGLAGRVYSENAVVEIRLRCHDQCSGADRAPPLAAARGPVGHGSALARSALRALARTCPRTAAPHSCSTDA